jgi:multiple sugar transport system substrate-binding protein
MRRFVALCVCALMALLAFGCGGSDESDNGGAGTGKSDGPVTLTVWYAGVPDPKVMDGIDQAYMAEHPNVTIDRVVQPAAAYFGELLRATIAKRKGPDVLAMYASPFSFDFENGFLPLNDFITDQQRKDIVGWEQSTTPDGNTLVVPGDAAGEIFYYDKAKFAKAGLDPEAPPQTWDELLTACDKLNAAGIVPISAGFKDGGLLELLLMAFSPQYQTEDEQANLITDPNYDSPALHKTLDLMKELYDRKCFTPHSEAINLFPDAANNFKAGKAAIMLGFEGSDLHWAQWRETKWGKDGLGVFLPPLVPDSNLSEPGISYGASGGYAIAKWSPNPQAAYDYLMYLGSPEVQKKLFDEAGALPSNITTELSSSDPVAQQILEWIKSRQKLIGQFNVARGNVEALFLKHAPQLISGKTSYDEVAPELQAEQQKSAE